MNCVTIFGVVYFLFYFTVCLLYCIVSWLFFIIVDHCVEQPVDHLYRLVAFSICIRLGHSKLLSVILRGTNLFFLVRWIFGRKVEQLVDHPCSMARIIYIGRLK